MIFLPVYFCFFELLGDLQRDGEGGKVENNMVENRRESTAILSFIDILGILVDFQ